MSDGDVQAVGIIVGDVLPVDPARAERDAALGAEVLEAVGFDLGEVGGHHLRDGRAAVILEADEDEALENLDIDLGQAELVLVERGIGALEGQAGQLAVEAVGPGVIGADQPFGAARGSVDQPGAAVAADVGEGAERLILAADHDHAFAEIFEGMIVTDLGDVADVADDLPGRAHHAAHLDLEIFGSE